MTGNNGNSSGSRGAGSPPRQAPGGGGALLLQGAAAYRGGGGGGGGIRATKRKPAATSSPAGGEKQTTTAAATKRATSTTTTTTAPLQSQGVLPTQTATPVVLATKPPSLLWGSASGPSSSPFPPSHRHHHPHPLTRPSSRSPGQRLSPISPQQQQQQQQQLQQSSPSLPPASFVPFRPSQLVLDLRAPSPSLYSSIIPSTALPAPPSSSRMAGLAGVDDSAQPCHVPAKSCSPPSSALLQQQLQQVQQPVLHTPRPAAWLPTPPPSQASVAQSPHHYNNNIKTIDQQPPTVASTTEACTKSDVGDKTAVFACDADVAVPDADSEDTRDGDSHAAAVRDACLDHAEILQLRLPDTPFPRGPPSPTSTSRCSCPDVDMMIAGGRRPDFKRRALQVDGGECRGRPFRDISFAVPVALPVAAAAAAAATEPPCCDCCPPLTPAVFSTAPPPGAVRPKPVRAGVVPGRLVAATPLWQTGGGSRQASVPRRPGQPQRFQVVPPPPSSIGGASSGFRPASGGGGDDRTTVGVGGRGDGVASDASSSSLGSFTTLPSSPWNSSTPSETAGTGLPAKSSPSSGTTPAVVRSTFSAFTPSSSSSSSSLSAARVSNGGTHPKAEAVATPELDAPFAELLRL